MKQIKDKEIKVYINDKEYRKRFITAFNFFYGDKYKLQEISESIYFNLEHKTPVITDQIIENNNTMFVLKKDKHDIGYIFSSIDNLFEQIENYYEEIERLNKECRIISFINLNFSTYNNIYLNNLIETINQNHKILRLNANTRLDSFSVHDSSMDQFCLIDKIENFNIDDLSEKGSKFDYIDGFSLGFTKFNNVESIFTDIKHTIKESIYDFTFIEYNFTPEKLAIDIIKASDLSLLFYSKDFGNDYINKILKYFEKNNILNKTHLLSINSKKSNLQAKYQITEKDEKTNEIKRLIFS